MRSGRSHRMYLKAFISHEKPLCFEKNNMKISFIHGVGKPASLGNLPPRKQSRGKSHSLCKIACVSTVNANTPQTVIMHHASTLK